MSDPSFLSKLPAPIAKILMRVFEWLKALSMATRIVLFSAIGLAIVAGIVFIPRVFAEEYTPLFTNLDQSDSGAVVAKLKELKIPYRLNESGTSIEVPQKKVADVRLELAGAGLPRGGGVGFESFDKMRLGATDFEQRVMYRRALEGELARTIGNLGAVQSARVHLVLPEKSVFVSRTEPASASIVVKLRPGHTLGSGEVAGIVNLTASSAPGLSPDHITLLSADGSVLHRPKREGADGEEGDGESLGQARNLEASLEERARSMVERIVGIGHADVRVSAELDRARVERTEDHFDPHHSVLRSEEATVEHMGAAGDSVAGVPGAEANLPTGTNPGSAKTPAAVAAGATSAAPASPLVPAPGASAGASAAPLLTAAPASINTTSNSASATAGSTVRESHTRNFEVDRVTEKRVMNGGALKRLTVSVVVDGVADGHGGFAPRGKEEMDKIASLVRTAVGLHDARGDAITVESVPFAVAELGGGADSAEHKPAVDVAALLSKVLATRNGKIGVGVASALLFLMLVVAARRAGARKKARLAAKEAEEAIRILKAAEEEKPALPPAPVESPVDLRTAAQERAIRDPATAALVVRAWLGTSEQEERLTGS